MAFVVTAVAAAIETTTVATVMTAIASVGTTMSVVGAVTGNKNLMKIGGEIGLVGGIGGMAAGAFSDAAGAAAEGLSGGLDGAAGDNAASWLGSDAGDMASNAASTSSIANPADGISQATNGTGKMGGDTLQSTVPDSWDQITNSKGGIINQSQNQAAVQPGSAQSVGTNAGATDSFGGPANNGNTFNDTAYDNANGIDTTLSTPYSKLGDAADSLKQKLGAMWDKLSPQAQAELMKSALAIPGGIQAQKNKEAELAIQQQKVNQTSYGSQVPTFGIINKARG